MSGFRCKSCKEIFFYRNEVIFDSDEEKIVSEKYPDWSTCECFECFKKENENE